MSSFYWAAFPFDNLCLVEDPPANYTYAGVHTFNVTDLWGDNPQTFNRTVYPTDPVYRYCNQDFILRVQDEYYFPFIYREGVEGGGEWMTEDQRFLTSIYGWTSVGILCTTAGRFLLTFLWYIKGIFHMSFDVSYMHTLMSTLGLTEVWFSNVFSPFLCLFSHKATIKGLNSTTSVTLQATFRRFEVEYFHTHWLFANATKSKRSCLIGCVWRIDEFFVGLRVDSMRWPLMSFFAPYFLPCRRIQIETTNTTIWLRMLIMSWLAQIVAQNTVSRDVSIGHQIDEKVSRRRNVNLKRE